MNSDQQTLEQLVEKRVDSWTRLFKNEDYQEVADTIEHIVEKHGCSKLLKQPVITHLKSKTSSSHAHKYIEAMHSDLEYKIQNKHSLQAN